MKLVLVASDETSFVYCRLLSNSDDYCNEDNAVVDVRIIDEDGGIDCKPGDDCPVFSFTAFSRQGKCGKLCSLDDTPPSKKMTMC